MGLWTCKKCSSLYEPINQSRICRSCRNTKCVECGILFDETEKAHKERCDECSIVYRRKRASNWYSDNKDKKSAYDKTRREKKRHLYRGASKRFRDNHPAKKRAESMARRYGLRKATPEWASMEYMNLFYRFAKIESERTGKHVHVDHIYPLNSKWVCGLHCEDNMQLLFAEDNIRKSNHYSFEHEGRQ